MPDWKIIAGFGLAWVVFAIGWYMIGKPIYSIVALVPALLFFRRASQERPSG